MRILSIFITVCTIALTSVGTMAQRTYDPKFYLGGKGGVTLSNMAFSPSIKQKMTQGVMFGIVGRYTEEKIFGLQAELNVEQRGWKEDFEETEFDYQRKLTYIQLPLMTHIYFGNNKIKGFINLGPSVGYMISEKITANFDYRNPSAVENFPIANRHVNQMTMDIKNKFDYGICAGGGVEFTVRQKHSIFIEGRYYYGIGNVFSARKKDEFSASRGTSIQVTLGYMFRVK